MENYIILVRIACLRLLSSDSGALSRRQHVSFDEILTCLWAWGGSCSSADARSHNWRPLLRPHRSDPFTWDLHTEKATQRLAIFWPLFSGFWVDLERLKV